MEDHEVCRLLIDEQQRMKMAGMADETLRLLRSLGHFVW